MTPDQKSLEPAASLPPLAANDNRLRKKFRPLLADTLPEGNGWYFQPSYLGEDLIDFDDCEGEA